MGAFESRERTSNLMDSFLVCVVTGRGVARKMPLSCSAEGASAAFASPEDSKVVRMLKTRSAWRG
jgi:hypothetical protein